MLSSCLFSLYAEYIMRNAELDEAQAGIKIAGRNINNLRYADGPTLWQKIKRNLKSLLMKVKDENEKAGFSKMKIMASGPITSNTWGNNGNSGRLFSWDFPKFLQMVTVAMKLKDACSLEKL